MDFFRLLGILLCVVNPDLKATIEELRDRGIIDDEAYHYIVGEIERRL